MTTSANASTRLATADPERYLSVSRAHRPIPRADGGLWFASDLAGHTQVFEVDRPLGWPTRVAPSTDRTLPVAAPRGRELVVRHDQGGNETWQLSLLRSDGILRPLTTDTRAIHSGAVLGPDRRRLGLAYNPGGQVDFVLGTLDINTGRIEDWLKADGMWQWSDWRPDGEQAVVTRALAPTQTEAYLLDRSGSLTQLLPGAKRVEDPVWAGGRLLALTDHRSEFLRVVELDPADPNLARIVYAADHADIEAIVPSHRGDRAVVVTNRGAYDEMVVLDLNAGQRVSRLTPSNDDGIVYSDNVNAPSTQIAWSRDDSQIFVAWETPARPADIYELPVNRAWTAAGSSAPPHAVTPTEASYRSFDGESIPCLHFRGDDRPKPTVVYFHGGPESQSRGNFNPTVQLFAAAGLDVLMPNVRGSTGYGRRYYSLDDRELRWDSVRDGCEAARWLKREGLATTTAAMGGSYGGFMTLAVLVEDPALWDAAVDIVGIADWHTFFQNTSAWRRAQRAAEYGDPNNPVDASFLAEFSPLRRAHLITAPMLVIHGRNDVRVPVSEAEQIVKATGAELLIFDDEGHGIVRHGNRVRAFGRALDFLRSKLDPVPANAADSAE
jgi:dipeptidyl aminopeptidase/acylaminoacyl peptidase